MTDHDPATQPAETATQQPTLTARRATNMAREMRVGLSIIVGLLVTLGAVLYYRIDADARKATAMKARLEQTGEQAPGEQPLQFDESQGWDPSVDSAPTDSHSTAAIASPTDDYDNDWSNAPAHVTPSPPDNPFAQTSQPAAQSWSNEWDQGELADAPAAVSSDAPHDSGHDADFPQFAAETQDLSFGDDPELTNNATMQWQDEDDTAEPGLFAPDEEAAVVESQPARRTVVSEPVDDRWARRPGAAVAPASAGETPWSDRRSADNFEYESAQPAAGSMTSDTGVFDRHDNSYTVGPNENFWSISKRLYGSGAYFKALYEHNRRNYPYPNKLRVGDVISAPPLNVLEQTYPQLCPKRSTSSNSGSNYRPVAHRQHAPGSSVYVVVEGDTLTDIARYELGRATRWTEIYDLNREVLGDNHDYLRPGTELLLPGGAQPDRLTETPSSVYQR